MDSSTSTGSESESSAVARRVGDSSKPSTSGVVVKKARKCANVYGDKDERIIALLRDMPNEIINKMNYQSNAFQLFGRAIAAQLEEFPPQQAYELQAEIQNIILMKRRQVSGAYNQANSCLTPAPSLASPEPFSDLDASRTPSTPSTRIYTNL